MEGNLSWVFPSIVSLLIGYILGYLVSLLFRYRARSYDDSDERRRSFEKVDFPTVPENVKHEKGWLPNKRGMLLYRQQFIPEGKLKGVVGICHGFTDHNNLLGAELALQFCAAGFAVLCCDIEGHGYSDGMHAYVEDLKYDIAGDLSDYFLSQVDTDRFNGLPFFLYSESMGGAVAFYICTEHEVKKRVSGVVLTCPMVKVSDELKPPDFVINLLRKLAVYFPYAPIVPVPNILEKSFKRKDVLDKVKKCPLSYVQKPRLRTGIVCVDATDDINDRMERFEHPVLILHGAADTVTCPKISQQFHDRCSSPDKTFILYPDAWHNLLHAEPTDVGQKIFTDIVQWMTARCG